MKTVQYVSGVCLAGVLIVAAVSGCQNAGQGAVSGGAIGALGGLAIGSLTGNAGAGAAIGAVAGAVGGGIIGDQNRRRAEAASSQPAPLPPPPPQPMAPVDRDRISLGKMAGTWTLVGWSEVSRGNRETVSGSATGMVEQQFFLRLDMNASVASSGQRRAGTLTFASEPGRGVTLLSRFDDSPSMARFAGMGNQDSSLITLDETDMNTPAVRRRVVIRFLSPDQWVADVQNVADASNPLIGSFSFSRAR